MAYNDFGIDTEGMTPEEIHEMMDSIVLSMAEQADEEDKGNAINNPKKIKMVLETYKALSKIAKGKGVKVGFRINEPYRSMASVSVVGKDIVFSDTETFYAAARLASNLDIYPKTDGTIKMDFTFHDITLMLD